MVEFWVLSVQKVCDTLYMIEDNSIKNTSNIIFLVYLTQGKNLSCVFKCLKIIKKKGM